MKTTMLTFLSQSCSFHTVDEYGDAKMSSPGLKMADLNCKQSEKSMLGSAIHKIMSTDAKTGIFFDDGLLLWPLPVSPWPR